MEHFNIGPVKCKIFFDVVYDKFVYTYKARRYKMVDESVGPIGYWVSDGSQMRVVPEHLELTGSGRSGSMENRIRVQELIDAIGKLEPAKDKNGNIVPSSFFEDTIEELSLKEFTCAI
jgi:hypothetical protein